MDKGSVALLLLQLLLLPALVSAAAPPQFENALCRIYDALKSILPVLIIVVLTVAAVIFVVGQVLGAEMRAKANSWAQHIVVYSVVAILVLLVVPWLLQQIDPSLNLERACPSNFTNSSV